MFHPGHVESCHAAKEDVSWYVEEKCSAKFVSNLSKGKFIACGTSGGCLWIFRGKEILASDDITFYNYDDKNGEHCCNFVFGQECTEKTLKRRWSCCKVEVIGTLHDMIKVRGCKKIYNTTE